MKIIFKEDYVIPKGTELIVTGSYSSSGGKIGLIGDQSYVGVEPLVELGVARSMPDKFEIVPEEGDRY